MYSFLASSVCHMPQTAPLRNTTTFSFSHIDLNSSYRSLGLNMRFPKLLILVLCRPFLCCAFSAQPTNSMFETLKWGGEAPAFDVLEKTKEYVSSFQTNGTPPGPEYYHKDYVLRGPVIGPINYKDLRAGQEGFEYATAFPDLKIETFGYTIDPDNPFKCYYFQRWRATHTGTLMAGNTAFEATGNKMETPTAVFSVVWTPDQNIIYEQVGAPVDR